MRKIDLDELKLIQIGILDYVSEFCDNNNIKYWIDSGTLLGAIRHKGYIPWDDDIDIGMLREDYEKFIKIFNKNNSHYKLYCNELDKKCPYALGKVMDIDTVLYEPNEDGVKIAINIDIFVYDNAPETLEETNKLYDLRDRYNYLRMYQNFSYMKYDFFRNIYIKILRFILSFLPKGYFAKKMIELSKKNVSNNTGKVGNFLGCTRIHSNKSALAEITKVEFEGKKYNAPKGYDEWLTDFYGDYMKLPPEEKRVGHHYFKAYHLDNNKDV